MSKRLADEQYPTPDDMRSGIKVKWYYYKDETAARWCAKIGRARSYDYEAEGYDFGYQSPGSCHLVKKGPYTGLWEVCLP